MAAFSYRALSPTGQLTSGVLLVDTRAEAMERLRQSGLTPIEATETATRATKVKSPTTATRRAVANVVSELSVLLGAGLPLERALAVCVENAVDPALKAVLVQLQKGVKEGAPLSRAMAQSSTLFSPMACAMVEAGEADGRLAVALSRLAETLERAEALRQVVASSMVYPILLTAVTGAVILMMLLFVVPQFEGLFSDNAARLPLATRIVMAASHGVRDYGLAAVLGGGVVGAVIWRWLKRPAVRLTLDRLLLGAPRLGPLIKAAETSRLARVLGSLVEGGVPLPSALAIARRSLTNTHMAAAVERVTAGLKEGGGLTRPLAATGLFPTVAISFLRTGEETAQLPRMLSRLADVLDRDVRNALERFVALLTPAITIVMGVVVGGIIASIMSAILGFNDMAIAP